MQGGGIGSVWTRIHPSSWVQIRIKVLNNGAPVMIKKRQKGNMEDTQLFVILLFLSLEC
jgi:hypothetical protein